MPTKTRFVAKTKVAPVTLPEDLAIDFEAFCMAHFNAEKGEVIRQALRFLIDTRVDQEPQMKARYLQARATLTKAPGAVVKLRAATGPDAPISDSGK